MFFFQDDYHYQQTGVKFMLICPGVTNTNFLNNLSDRVRFPEIREMIANQTTTASIQE